MFVICYTISPLFIFLFLCEEHNFVMSCNNVTEFSHFYCLNHSRVEVLLLLISLTTETDKTSYVYHH